MSYLLHHSKWWCIVDSVLMISFWCYRNGNLTLSSTWNSLSPHWTLIWYDITNISSSLHLMMNYSVRKKILSCLEYNTFHYWFSAEVLDITVYTVTYYTKES
jgi:hypothetical protein